MRSKPNVSLPLYPRLPHSVEILRREVKVLRDRSVRRYHVEERTDEVGVVLASVLAFCSEWKRRRCQGKDREGVESGDGPW
jgi:hypothetical protein